jgi:hypothetical protein
MWETIKEVTLAAIDRPGLILMILGAAVMALGAAGGITYGNWLPLTTNLQQASVGGVGLLLFLVGVVWLVRTPQTSLNAKSFGVKITDPQAGDKIGVVTVRGTIRRSVPPGYELRLLRMYPGQDGYLPMNSATIDDTGKKWEAYGCDIGGRPGEQRIIAACLVGPSGKVLLNFYRVMARLYNPAREQIITNSGPTPPAMPLIDGFTTDMHVCTRIAVTRA